MSLKNIPNKIDYNHNSYLSTLDLINKYNISEKKKIPSLDQIVFILPLKPFTDKFIDQNLSEFDLEVQIKSVVVLYILNLNIPYIRFNNLKFFKTKENHLSLKITLTDNFIKNQFLSRLFLEKKTIISDLKLIKQKDLKVNKSFLQQKKFILTSSLLINNFFEIENLFNRIFLGINSNEFSIKIHFIFNNFSNVVINYKNLIKNFPIFWINN